MANENQANEARRAHGRKLLAAGAHGVGVEHGKNGWVVVAHVAPGADVKMPMSLTARHDGKEAKVPLVVKHADPFAPE